MHSAKTVNATGYNMNITVNGNNTEIKDGAFVSDLIEEIKATLPEMFVIELNDQVVYKENFEITRLSQGDSIKVVVFSDKD